MGIISYMGGKRMGYRLKASLSRERLINFNCKPYHPRSWNMEMWAAILKGEGTVFKIMDACIFQNEKCLLSSCLRRPKK